MLNREYYVLYVLLMTWYDNDTDIDIIKRLILQVWGSSFVHLCAYIGVLSVIINYALQLKFQSIRLCIMNAVCDQYYSKFTVPR